MNDDRFLENMVQEIEAKDHPSTILHSAFECGFPWVQGREVGLEPDQ